MGYRADTCYCIALCHYMLNQYAAALKYITEIIERGIKEHPGEWTGLDRGVPVGSVSDGSFSPELSVGMQTEGVDIRSVGNTAVSEQLSGFSCE